MIDAIDSFGTGMVVGIIIGYLIMGLYYIYRLWRTR